MLSGKFFHNGIILLEKLNLRISYVTAAMQIYDFLCHTVFTHYPFSYLTVIFTHKDFIQLNPLILQYLKVDNFSFCNLSSLHSFLTVKTNLVSHFCTLSTFSIKD